MPTVRRRKSPGPGLLLKGIARKIQRHTQTVEFSRYLRDLLLELCRIDTTPHPDVGRMRESETACFRVLERELTHLPFPGEIRRVPINPAIQSHAAYSLLHFTKTPDRPEGLSAEQTYADRANLLYIVRGSGDRPSGQSVAVNAHLDVVLPYFSPRARDGSVHGRGACDDKGPVVAILGALKVLASAMKQAGLKWNRNVLGMFVVEEETGGNGSLSLAVDRRLRRLYDSVLVCECTGLKLHPANRGAVWYRAELHPPRGGSRLEMAALVIEEMEREGAAIRAESRHPLFPQRPVQTCHGIIGSFGEHPSRICGDTSFRIFTPHKPDFRLEALVRDCLDSGLTGYIGQYGDKTKVTEPGTGKPMVAKHYELRRGPDGFVVDVFGAAGHMGSIRERDGAITKMACLVLGLMRSKERLETLAEGRVEFELAEDRVGHGEVRDRRSAQGLRGASSLRQGEALVLEGGQGFVPTHRIGEVMNRLRRAAQCGAERYVRQRGVVAAGEDLVKVSYEKLHNAAFDGNPDSTSMRNAFTAARLCRLWKDEPVLGWTVSCDARLFALEYPGMDVLTFGPGRLAFAHSDHEQIEIEEIRAAVEFLCLFLLIQTGTIPS